MFVIFPVLFYFTFFIWSCSDLMMMQILRCESAVTQGLRSDTLQATQKAASASVRPQPLYPLACWLTTSPLLPPALLLNPPRISEKI